MGTMRPQNLNGNNLDLKAPGAEFDASAYKFRAIVTNLLDWDGDRVIRWHRETLRQKRAGPRCPEERVGRRNDALKALRGERSLVADHRAGP